MKEDDVEGNYEIKLKHIRPVFFGEYGSTDVFTNV